MGKNTGSKRSRSRRTTSDRNRSAFVAWIFAFLTVIGSISLAIVAGEACTPAPIAPSLSGRNSTATSVSPSKAGDQALPGLAEARDALEKAADQMELEGIREAQSLPERISLALKHEPVQRRDGVGKTLIFVIDDAGNNLTQLEPFLQLPFPITVAVLPQLTYSEEASKEVKAAGMELILHQPMAALGGQNPGPGAILPSTSPVEAAIIVESNLQTVPGAVGINNHMGSAITTDLPDMEALAGVAKGRGIYYLDSLTVPGTASAEAAHREGIRYWERTVFLDNSPDRVSIFRAVEDGKKKASQGRPAIMIGHVWSSELAQALTDLYPQLVEEGYSLSTITRYMLSEATEDDESPGH